MTRITTTLHEGQYNFWSYLTHSFLEGEYFRQSCRENWNTHCMIKRFFFFFPENRDVYEIMWKRCGKARQPTNDNTIRLMRWSYWVPNATDTHSEYVILLAFPLQQSFHERASVLRYTYMVRCLSCLGYSLGLKCQCKEFISPKQLVLPSNIFCNHCLILLLGKMAPHLVTWTKLIYLLPLFLSIKWNMTDNRRVRFAHNQSGGMHSCL
jgi:hypothetical protein